MTRLRMIRIVLKGNGLSIRDRLTALLHLLRAKTGPLSLELHKSYVEASKNLNAEPWQADEECSPEYFNSTVNRPFRVQIIDHEAHVGISGVLTVIAQNLVNALNLIEGVEAHYSKTILRDFDHAHHIYYALAMPRSDLQSSALITHVDTEGKLRKVKYLLENEFQLVCMSNHTRVFLLDRLGEQFAPQISSCLIPPLTSGVSRKLKIGFVSATYPDGRKNEAYLLYLVTELGPREIEFWIMGARTSDLVHQIRSLGCDVCHWGDFDQAAYQKILTSVDLMVYPGWDEGAMSIMDAVTVGLPVVASRQGFHLELKSGSVRLFDSPEEFAQIIRERLFEPADSRSFGTTFTWEAYAINHLRFWTR